MEVPQLGAGLHADRLHESRACVPVGRQRFRLPARAIQREHVLRPHSLAQRLIRDQRPQLAEDLSVATRGEVGVDRHLGRLQPQLLQSSYLGARERLVSHVGERTAAPQRQRRPRFSVRHAVGLHGRVDQPLELGRIDAIDREPELVATAAGQDFPDAPAQQLAQLGHIQLHHLGRRRRGPLAPQSLAELIGRDGLVDLQREHRQHGALLRRSERYRPAVKARLDRPEEMDVHIVRRETTLLPCARRINWPINRTFTGVSHRPERPFPLSRRPPCPHHPLHPTGRPSSACEARRRSRGRSLRGRPRGGGRTCTGSVSGRERQDRVHQRPRRHHRHLGHEPERRRSGQPDSRFAGRRRLPKLARRRAEDRVLQ